jgi:D-alanyl-D-alanine carboxypeptidase
MTADCPILIVSDAPAPRLFRRLEVWVFAALAAASVACSGDSGTGPTDLPATAASVNISGAPASIVAGDTIQLTATVRTAAGATMSGAAVTWTSLDPTRLQALTGGRFIALDGGAARVAAQSGAVADTLTVTMESRRMAAVAVSVSSALFLTGDVERAQVTATDQRQRPMPATGLEWTTSNAAAAIVSTDGTIEALAPGDATVTVRGPDAGQGRPSAVLQLRVTRGAGPRVPELQRVDSAVVAWMTANSVPGAQVAVMYQGRLVLSRAYGVRDASTGAAVTLDALFRIGSVSKPIAGLAFMRLVDEGVVNLDDRPVATLLASHTPLPGETVDPRLANATAREILRHQTGYGNRDVDNRVWQGVWQFQAMQPDAHFRYGLGVPLGHAPGTIYGYTNYNTQIIARYIEARTGHPFVTHVQQELLLPAGITRMEYGRGPLAQRNPAEVRPHNAQGLAAAQLNAGTAMAYYDASGSWIANAADLMRLLRRVEDGGTPLLSAAARAEIATKNAAVSGTATQFYGLHWSIREGDGGVTWSHTGAAEGAWAFIMRRNDGVSFVILTNRDMGNPALSFSLEPFLTGVTWPAHDLFPDVP